MKVALNISGKRIAPLLDVGMDFYLCELKEQKVVKTTVLTSNELFVEHRIRQLSRLGVQLLICGAISRQCRLMVELQGIQVVGFLSAEYQEVIDLLCRDSFKALQRFSMPGCQMQPRRRRRRNKLCRGI
jgi:predicted Fe-Mo cluster-binding NifX family protein